MELLDVLDSNGFKTGIIKDKKQVYNDGDFHRAVHIWIMNSNDEILVQKRSPKKETFPNLWAISVAGHVRSGETSIEAAIREIKEEIGKKVTEEDLIYLFTLKREQALNDKTLRVIDDVYIIYLDIDVENTKLQFSELTDIKYVYYEYLENIFKDHDENYVPYTEEHVKLFEYLKDKKNKK